LKQTSLSCANCKKKYGHSQKPVPWQKGSSSGHFCTREEIREEPHDILKRKKIIIRKLSQQNCNDLSIKPAHEATQTRIGSTWL